MYDYLTELEEYHLYIAKKNNGPNVDLLETF